MERREVLASLVWAGGPALPAARGEAVAIAAPDGATLVMGGTSAGDASTVYRLAAGAASWSTAAAINGTRLAPGAGHTSSGGILLFGGKLGNEATDEALLYDYYGGDSQDASTMISTRWRGAFATDGAGHPYAIGGVDVDGVALGGVERYSLATDEWESLADLPAKRVGASAAYDGTGHVYVFGGGASNSLTAATATTYRYTIDADAWEAVAPMPVATRDSVAVLGPAGSIYVLGGLTPAGTTAVVQVYNPATNAWSLDTDLPQPVSSAAAALDALGHIVVAGGYNTSRQVASTVYLTQRLNVPETAPAITSAAVTSGSTDRFYTYQVVAAGNPQPVYSLPVAPAGMTINPATGLISWQPVAGQEGAQAVTVRASNRVGSADQSFAINVVGDTIPPSTPTGLVVTGVSTTAISLAWDAATDNKAIGGYRVYEVKKGGYKNTHTYYYQRADVPVTSATLSGLVPNSSHKYVVKAYDASGNLSGYSLYVIGRTTSVPTLSYGGAVNLVANHELVARLYSAANPAPTFSLPDGPSGMSVNATTGELRWTPGVADIGTRAVTFRAANSIGSTDLTVNLTVTPDLPALRYTFPAGSAAVAGQPFVVQVFDSSNTPATFELVDSPAGATINATTGLVAWTPTPADAGSQSLTVRAANSAGASQITASFYVHFTSAVQNIAVTGVTSLVPVASWSPPADESNVAGYQVVARYTVRLGRGHSTRSVSFDSPGTGTTRELPGLVAGRKYSLSVTAYDAAGNRGQPVAQVVEFVYAPALPALGYSFNPASGGAAYAIVNRPLAIQLTDSRGTNPTYSLVSGPAGMSVDPASGLVAWTPGVADIGNATAVFRATNGVGPADITLNFPVYFAGPPTAIAVTNATSSTHSADVAWTAPSDNAAPVAGYRLNLIWSINGHSYSQLYTSSGPATSFTLTGLVAGPVLFKVQVAAIDELGREGPYSAATTFILDAASLLLPPVF